nr:putative ribonuclease H-like domain-containing protein [Tanacetum cinerariifolium]
MFKAITIKTTLHEKLSINQECQDLRSNPSKDRDLDIEGDQKLKTSTLGEIVSLEKSNKNVIGLRNNQLNWFCVVIGYKGLLLLLLLNKGWLRGTLLTGLPDKHQLKFNIHKDAKTLMEAIEKRFGGNKETKKVQKTLLKQQYENFTGSRSESLDQIHDRLQKLISQLEILGESLSQEDINLKFLRSLPAEWRTHTLIWRNKADLEDQSLDDLFNSLKIYEAEVKSSSSTSSTKQNITFVSSQNTDSTNELISVVASVSHASTKVPVFALPNVDTLSDAVIYSFFANGYADYESKDISQRKGRNLRDNGTTLIGFDMSKVEYYNYHRRGHFARECRSPKDNKNKETQRRNVAMETSTSIALVSEFDDWVSDSEDDSKCEHMPTQKAPSFVQTTKHVKTPRPSVKPVKHLIPFANLKTDIPKSKGHGNNKNRKACFVCKSFTYLIKDYDYYEKKMVQTHSRNHAHRGNHQRYVRMTHPNRHRHVIPSAVLTRSKLVPLTAARLVTTAVLHNNVIRPRPTKIFVTKPHSPKRRIINHRPSPHASNFYQRVTTAKAPQVNAVKGVKGNWMCDKKNNFIFTNTECIVLSPEFKLPDENQVLLRVPRENNMYNVDLKNIVPSGDLTCLFAKATLDDRFTWVFFLATKDETSPILKTFITGIENQLSLKVKIIKSDNGTEFKNQDLNQFCRMKGIKREFSVARTPQQNGIAERKNRTLIEAARAMLADSLLPIPFWAEAVNTACYVQNRVLVTKPHNKTPYKLLLSRTPSICFMRPFGCLVTILNTLDPLGKFDGKADEGFLVGYSVSSKAFRVFNSRTRIVQDTLHINFLENQPNVAGSGPTWLFDIDTLTKSMNYQPVTAGNQPNPSAGVQNILMQKKQEREMFSNMCFFPYGILVLKILITLMMMLPLKLKSLSLMLRILSLKFMFLQAVVLRQRNMMTRLRDRLKARVLINEVNAASTPVPAIGQISTNSTNIFNAAGPSNTADNITYSDDDEDVGAEADFTNLETTVTVSPILTTRVHKHHPVTQIISDLSLATQTRSMTRMVKDQEGLTEINNEDFHTCMFGCFLSQEEPKRVHQALKYPSWIEAMQEELL